jgi:hypothetical protein
MFPHADRPHVVERFRMIEGGKTVEVNVNVEDPGVFTTPWNAIQRYRRVERGPMVEQVCAENNANYFNQQAGFLIGSGMAGEYPLVSRPQALDTDLAKCH